ncbi:MAG: hypothetical protein NT169_12015 [Chloroflexi bacterium]|nr:hypothetical protein [Chloroflexota bacterium]
MRGILAGLLVASLVLVLALLIATVGSVGVALIGLLLHHWFDLTQWQGSLIAVVVGGGLSLVVYRTVAAASVPTTYSDNWDDDEEEEDEEDEEEYEPPIVPWRRSRPTPGELPVQKPTSTPSKPVGKKK